jgi:hypothetical protein
MKRKWTVPLLCEFEPADVQLLGLNVNAGAKILVRHCRAHGGFFDETHVFGTLLHELVHIFRGPHDSVFYRLLDELWNEYENEIR